MGQIELIYAGVAAYLLIFALIIRWFGIQISESHQHQLAFATIILLVVGVIPLLKNKKASNKVNSKYIGETEKNLGKLSNTGEDRGNILFFDEANAQAFVEIP